MRYHELHSGVPLQWLWQGYLAPGNITLLTSQWKSGKTTLVAALLQHMKAGGALAGLPVRPGNAILLSEEDPALWFERGRRFDYANHIWWLCRPFRGKPSSRQFDELLHELLALHAQTPQHLLVIDALASFLPPGCENNADAIVNFLAALQMLTAAGLAVLILHHPRKQRTGEGRAARGSGALSGAVDILMEMHWVSRPSSTDRRRRLKSWSRHQHTPPRLIIELNEAGTDYTAVDLAESRPKMDSLPLALRHVLTDASYKLTLQSILDDWPRHERRPNMNLLWRWLSRAVKDGLVLRDGTGHKDDPHRYWLPEREQEWLADPIACMWIENWENYRRAQREKKGSAGDQPAAPGQ
jgi:hypothetical protein